MSIEVGEVDVEWRGLLNVSPNRINEELDPFRMNSKPKETIVETLTLVPVLRGLSTKSHDILIGIDLRERMGHFSALAVNQGSGLS
jgi:hypothetical protein